MARSLVGVEISGDVPVGSIENHVPAHYIQEDLFNRVVIGSVLSRICVLVGALQDVFEGLNINGRKFVSEHFIRRTSILHGDNFFNLAITREDNDVLWLQMSHSEGLHLFNLQVRPMIDMLDSLTVQERGPRTCSFGLFMGVSVHCAQPWLVYPGILAQGQFRIVK